MNHFDLAKTYKNKGYCNLQVLFDNEQVEYLRRTFEKNFSKVEKFCPNLALSIKEVMDSVLSKYNQYL